MWRTHDRGPVNPSFGFNHLLVEFFTSADGKVVSDCGAHDRNAVQERMPFDSKEVVPIDFRRKEVAGQLRTTTLFGAVVDKTKHVDLSAVCRLVRFTFGELKMFSKRICS